MSRRPTPNDDDPPKLSTHAAFAASTGGGNVAGVVLSDRALPTHRMEITARTLGLPTIAFGVVTSEHEVATRMFTSDGEIDSCGHASASVAAELFSATGGELDRVTTHAPGGSIPFTVAGSLEDPTVTMDMSVRSWNIEPPPRGLVELLGSTMDPDRPIARVRTGLTHLVVAVTDRRVLNRLRFDHDEWRRVGRDLAVDTIGLVAIGSDGRVELRDICAPIGDTEEAASGTTATGVTWHLHQLGLGHEFDIRQGVAMGRPSRLHTVITRAGARLSGQVRRLSESELDVTPDET